MKNLKEEFHYMLALVMVIVSGLVFLQSQQTTVSAANLVYTAPIKGKVGVGLSSGGQILPPMLSGVQITVTQNQVIKDQVSTASNGSYQTMNLPEGTYAVDASLSGYTFQYVLVDVVQSPNTYSLLTPPAIVDIVQSPNTYYTVDFKGQTSLLGCSSSSVSTVCGTVSIPSILHNQTYRATCPGSCTGVVSVYCSNGTRSTTNTCAIDTPGIKQITSSLDPEQSPDISGNNVVWGNLNTDRVYSKNLGNNTQIEFPREFTNSWTNANLTTLRPEISGGYIVASYSDSGSSVQGVSWSYGGLSWQKIAASSGVQGNGVIDGYSIVFDDDPPDFTPSNIYFYRFGQNVPLTNQSTYFHYAKDVFSDSTTTRVLWERTNLYAPGTYELYYCEFPTTTSDALIDDVCAANTTLVAVQSMIDFKWAKISRDGIAYTSVGNLTGYNIVFYSFITRGYQNIVQNIPLPNGLHVFEGKVVWSENRNNNINIYLRDVNQSIEQQITGHPTVQMNPRISGNKIVWEDYRNLNADIFMYDLGVCGNGILETGEVCDDGNTSNTDSCLNTCRLAVCGDGYVRSGVEGCDDGNTVSGDGCSATCTVEVNILSNGSFEQGQTGWTDWGTNKVLTTETAYAGPTSVQFTLGSLALRTLTHNVITGIVPGRTYKVSFAIRTNTTGYAYVKLIWRTSGGIAIGSPITFGGTMGTTAWSVKTSSLIAPSNATRLRVLLETGKGTGVAYFDDVKVIGN